MHGTGNDFILLLNLKDEKFDFAGMAKQWCDRHFGIGADGLILILPSQHADFKMRIFNADGTEAEMCGNGIRCFARHVYENKLISGLKFKVETLAGIVEPECQISDGRVQTVRVNMGVPRYGDLHPRKGEPLSFSLTGLMKKIELPEGTVEGATVSMGNPHFVVFGEKGSKWSCDLHGKTLSTHPVHPHQSNVEFVQVEGKDSIRVQVWERGAGPTLACGSGACASVAAGRILKNLPEKVRVEMPGGPLLVEWKGEGTPIFLTGPAVYVFEGEVSEELLKKAPASKVSLKTG